MSELLKVGITHGDYNGVGYEVALRAMADETVTELYIPVFYGIPALVEKTMNDFELELPELKIINNASEAEEGYLNIVDLGIKDVKLTPGHPDRHSGAAAVAALEKSVADVMGGVIDTLVTAPISKEAVQTEKFQFPGHTEFFGARSDSKPLMILYYEGLRMALLTTHKAIADIPCAVTKERVMDTVRALDSTLKQDFDIQAPKIAVLSLNPHNGDGGLLGTEEIRDIRPAIEELGDSYLAFGPFAADGFFASHSWRKYDGVIAMYHDQGLAPFKALAGPEGVNFTAGLPFVRTSPDHGTGNDIAWQGIADPQSMRQAIYAAIDLTRNRRRNIEAAANPLPKMPERPDRGERRGTPQDRTVKEDRNSKENKNKNKSAE